MSSEVLAIVSLLVTVAGLIVMCGYLALQASSWKAAYQKATDEVANTGASLLHNRSMHQRTIKLLKKQEVASLLGEAQLKKIHKQITRTLSRIASERGE